MSGASKKLELKCPGCSRVLNQPEALLLQRLKEGKQPRCLFCARDVPLPDVLARQFDPASAQDEAGRVGTCPSCLRPAPASGGRGRCVSCAVVFRCDAAGHGSFDLPAETPAQREEVERAVERFASLPQGATIAKALRARRTRGSLAAGEPARLAHMAEGLARWDGVSRELRLPWVADEVRHLLAPFIFGAPWAKRDEARDLYLVQLSSMVDDARGGMSPGLSFALDAVDVAVEGKPPELATREYWIRLTDSPQGCRLDVSAARPGEAPEQILPEEMEALTKRLFRLVPALERYVRVAALCGPVMRGASSMRLSEEAARARLVELGVPAPQAVRLAPSFVIGALPR